MPDDMCRTCGKEIFITIFRGSGYCSVDCRSKAGVDHPPYGNMMVVTRAEQAMIHKIRETLNGTHA